VSHLDSFLNLSTCLAGFLPPIQTRLVFFSKNFKGFLQQALLSVVTGTYVPLRAMNTLQDIVPELLIPHVPELRPAPSAPSTEGYAPLSAPPQHHVPYWILHSPTLADSMMEELRRYLTTAPGGSMAPSSTLQLTVNELPDELLETSAGELSSEETTTQLWGIHLFPLIRYAVTEVDQNPTRPTLVMKRTLYSQTSDTLICPASGTLPRLHRENKSWAVFDAYAPEILALAQRVEEGWLGTSLELRSNEQGARSIIMNVSQNYLSPNLIHYLLLLDGCLYDRWTKSNTL
jgi:hypothetical protein